MGSGKPRGIQAARKLRVKRRLNKWADLGYKKAHQNAKWKKPFAGASHAAGIVVEKIGVEAKQPNSAVRKCVRVQLRKNNKRITAYVPRDGGMSFVDENDEVLVAGFGSPTLPACRLDDKQAETARAHCQRIDPYASIYAFEFAGEFGWHKYTGLDGRFIGMTSFGESAPLKQLMEHFDFTPERIAKAAMDTIAK